ncbi:MAG: TolC family protein [Bacteroidaceae bacterium]|nr:TolC family protein [Bacteroidaceae bacterium]
MRRTIGLLYLFLLLTPMYAQITLEQCQELAQENYPLIKQFGLIEKTTAYSVSNARKMYYPQLVVSAQVTNQSEVSNLPPVMKAAYEQQGLTIEGLSKTQYKAALSLNQPLFDGGVSHAEKQIAKATGQVRTAGVVVDLYAVRKRVNELFFGVLLLQKRAKQNKITHHLLERNVDLLKSRVKEGVLLQSDQDALLVQLLLNEQQLVQIESAEKAYRKMLSTFIGRELLPTNQLVKPILPTLTSLVVKRPELDLFTLRAAALDAQKKKLKTTLLPRIDAFATGFYGYPGYDLFANMLHKELNFNFQVGVKLKWNITSFYTHHNKLKILKNEQAMIHNERNQFLFSTSLQVTQQQAEADKMKALLQTDQQIIQLRTSIRKTAEQKLANGVVMVHDLLREVTAEEQAHLQQMEHEISLLTYMYALRNTVNEQ